MWALDPDCLGSNPDFTYNYLHEVSKWLKFSVSWFHHPLNGNTNSTYYIGILWGLNEVTYVMCLHLAPGKCWISISYFSSQIHSLESIFQKTQSIVWRLSIPNQNITPSQPMSTKGTPWFTNLTSAIPHIGGHVRWRRWSVWCQGGPRSSRSGAGKLLL